MSDESNNPKPFHIGLCLAGAVSAGAYTAGVIDFLLEALDEWEKRKKDQPLTTPNHEVKIPVIGGASAGGMTGLITGMTIHEDLKPVRNRADAKNHGEQNRLYHTWVNLTQEDMLDAMLDRSDLKQKEIRSLLNSNFIDQLAKDVTKFSDEPKERHASFTSDLKLFVTMSNLMGMDYSSDFGTCGSDLSRHIMSSHKDYACFQLASAQHPDDGWMPFDIAKDGNRSVVADAAMATGAFPVGLKNRKVSREAKFMTKNKWFHEIVTLNPDVFKSNPYEARFVDGGMINNEPFNRVREVLSEITGQTDEQCIQNYEESCNTILMIDPFPSEPRDYHQEIKVLEEAVLNETDRSKRENLKEKLSKLKKKDPSLLLNSIGATLGAMVSQLRVKPATLIEAMKPGSAGQFLISPIRKTAKGTEIEGKKALACGSLSGFAGFIHKDFREHDYFLGRANCEKFLRDCFTMPEDSENPYVISGYRHLPEDEKDKYRIIYERNGKREAHLPIIPIFKEASTAAYQPRYGNSLWPLLDKQFLQKKKWALRRRIGRVLIVIADLTPIWQFFLWAGNHIILRRKLAKGILEKIEDELKEWELMD